MYYTKSTIIIKTLYMFCLMSFIFVLISCSRSYTDPIGFEDASIIPETTNEDYKGGYQGSGNDNLGSMGTENLNESEMNLYTAREKLRTEEKSSSRNEQYWRAYGGFYTNNDSLVICLVEPEDDCIEYFQGICEVPVMIEEVSFSYGQLVDTYNMVVEMMNDGLIKSLEAAVMISCRRNCVVVKSLTIEEIELVRKMAEKTCLENVDCIVFEH